ncbi:hypothetical protein LBMAG21_16450 [Armatimonadota bacterium]|nr:hypothetical protein LBMAG21_16450 [Armatimonadota bacterium]
MQVVTVREITLSDEFIAMKASLGSDCFKMFYDLWIENTTPEQREDEIKVQIAYRNYLRSNALRKFTDEVCERYEKNATTSENRSMN